MFKIYVSLQSPNEGFMFKIYEEPASQVIFADRGCKFVRERSHK